MGYAGGLWLLWDSSQINLQIQGSSFQEIHATAEVLNFPPILLSFIYASPLRERRNILWENLKSLSAVNSLPWVIGGDFNDVMAADEKWGGRIASSSRINSFKACMDACGLVDLGFSGPKFTWCNKRHDGHLVFQRIDRFLANRDWLHLFPNASVSHLPRVKSDHNPIRFSSSLGSPSRSYRPFRCEKIWLSEPSFSSVVDQSWSSSAGSTLVDNLFFLKIMLAFGIKSVLVTFSIGKGFSIIGLRVSIEL